ncbi:MAG: exlusion protein FxsA [Proteobacteria bacterium]|nr:MAG: exlusion protein FxsA [Pseudomonadota bacterium]PIE40204.1 MAG: exlusion protein FxsA [Gammaproteobacteria bacterium]
MPVFFIFFIVIPVAEMAVLIHVGKVIGAWYTILLIFLTAVIGASLLKRQGVATLLRAHQKLNSGEIPAKEMFEGFLLALGGAFLLTPGFITDAIGFSLVIPQIRSVLVGYLAKKIVVNGKMGGGAQSRGFYYRSGQGFGQAEQDSPEWSTSGSDVIEGEFQEMTTKEDNPSRQDNPSGRIESDKK